ncbi:MAG: hypothetical protein K2K38_02730 [Clostridia bacterium]|nr:hypothetical protein [Clostridia bacterium]
MKICLCMDSRVNSSCRLPSCDIALFPFTALGEVDYESELSGKSEKFEEMARLSGVNKCAVLCGCCTLSRGMKRKSVAVAENGRLLGISDMLNVLDGDDYKSGAGLGVYKLKGYNVGVCIDSDLFFPDNFKTFSICGCNIVVVHTNSVIDNIPPLLIRSYAYLYGAPVVLCAEKTAYLAGIDGALACSNQKFTLFDVSPKNCYRVVTTRRKGLFADEQTDF